MEAVGVESASKFLIDKHFNDLEKYFQQCFSFSRDLPDHYCPLPRRAKNLCAYSRVVWNGAAD
jgi:hypothetical protein